MPISEAYTGLEWSSYEAELGSTNIAHDGIGVGVTNTVEILYSDGSCVSGKETAQTPFVTGNTTIWKALQTLKESKEDASLKSHTVNGYGWFIPSQMELSEIYNLRESIETKRGDTLDISQWKFSSGGGSLTCCWSSTESDGYSSHPIWHDGNKYWL